MPAEVHVHHEVHHPKKHTPPQRPHQHEVAAAVPAQRHVLPHEVKGFLEGGIAAIVAGVSTHPLDLIKVRMQVSSDAGVPSAYIESEHQTLSAQVALSCSTVLVSCIAAV